MMKKLVLSLVSLGFVALLAAQTPTATLRVEVYDLITGSSLNQATVRVVSSDNSIDRTASTGGYNAVDFGNLPINLTYTVTVSRADYRTRTLPGITLTRDTTNYIYAYLVSALQTVGSVAGTVRDAMTNQPLANVYVNAVLSNRSVWTLTDSNGQYRIDELPRAPYRISADTQGYHSQSVSASVAPNSTTTADMVLTPLSEPVGTLYGYYLRHPFRQQCEQRDGDADQRPGMELDGQHRRRELLRMEQSTRTHALSACRHRGELPHHQPGKHRAVVQLQHPDRSVHRLGVDFCGQSEWARVRHSLGQPCAKRLRAGCHSGAPHQRLCRQQRGVPVQRPAAGAVRVIRRASQLLRSGAG